MHTNVNADWIKAWIVYHNYIFNGDALYFFYNVGGLKDEDRHRFNDFVDAGLLNITDSTSHYSQLYPSWYYHQLLYIEDCLQRSRFLADYVFFFDFDEFLQVFLFSFFNCSFYMFFVRPLDLYLRFSDVFQIPAPETIESLLEKHKELPWLTVGSFPADHDHCTPAATSGLQYPVERMLWHAKVPECMHADEDPWMCIAAVGRRKWIANTKYTLLGGVHRAALPFEGGINMNASAARVIHFHGVLNPNIALCNHLVEARDYGNLGHMERNDGISRAFTQAKLLPVEL
jgi:hypothetical protein